MGEVQFWNNAFRTNRSPSNPAAASINDDGSGTRTTPTVRGTWGPKCVTGFSHWNKLNALSLMIRVLRPEPTEENTRYRGNPVRNRYDPSPRGADHPSPAKIAGANDKAYTPSPMHPPMPMQLMLTDPLMP